MNVNPEMEESNHALEFTETQRGFVFSVHTFSFRFGNSPLALAVK